jgi:cellulose synthase/poly-beta-1,6-N-acetylglucosamine synthase-like glycosyltransferase
MRSFARDAGIASRDIDHAELKAAEAGTDLCAELCARIRGADLLLYLAFAERCGLQFTAVIHPADLIIDSDDDAKPFDLPFVHYRLSSTNVVLLAAPPPEQLDALLQTLPLQLQAKRLLITTPACLNAAWERHREVSNLNHAIEAHAAQTPELSSRIQMQGWQGWLAGLMCGFAPAVILLFPFFGLTALHIIVGVFFLGCSLLRFIAAFAPRARRQSVANDLDLQPSEMLPRYTVLVAAYKEASVAQQLIEALSRLDWPKSRLDVIIACEKDDLETISAFHSLRPPPFIRIVEVPEGGPRTKPKALMYVLPMVRSEFLVLYDAEDRPHPGQLKEAWRAMRTNPDNLACVQAPLQVSNAGTNFLTRLFAFEYDALFRGLLPFLGKHSFFMPLGGTSNHFRVSLLRAAGGWDPFNVTEDADLGLRFHALGMKTAMITLPTLEDAPETFMVWLRQRTRWYKGYIQTWMVSLRRPIVLIENTSLSKMLITQALIGGLVMSAAAHGVFLLMLGLWVLMHGTSDFFGSGVFQNLAMFQGLALFDVVNIAFGYIAFCCLGLSHARIANWRDALRCVLSVPFYWALLSIAAWRAIFQIVRFPHLWEKTPHMPHLPLQGPEPSRPIAAI